MADRVEQLWELADWLEREAEEQMKSAIARRSSAECLSIGSAADNRAAHKLAEQMAGRKFTKSTPAQDRASAQMQSGIADKIEAEAKQLSRWADCVRALALPAPMADRVEKWDAKRLIEWAYINKSYEGFTCRWCQMANDHKTDCFVAAALALPAEPPQETRSKAISSAEYELGREIRGDISYPCGCAASQGSPNYCPEHAASATPAPSEPTLVETIERIRAIIAKTPGAKEGLLELLDERCAVQP